MAASRLENLGITFPYLIAPMVGLSNVAFRSLIRSYTPASVHALMFTEMLSTRRLPEEKLETTNELKCAPNEMYYVPQLLGNEEKYIAPSVVKLLTQNPWGFDINMGCPVTHTLKHNWGVRLMGDKNYAAEIVRATKRHSSKPVSVKLRGGIAETETVDYLIEFTDALEKAGVDWLTVHPRPRAQRHKGEANWSIVGDVRRARSIPVVANGDIQTADDALFVMSEFGVDGAMIARAATARPWILWQIALKLGIVDCPEGMDGIVCPQTPEEEGKEYVRACLRLIDFMRIYFPTDEYILEKFCFFAATGARWYQFGHAFWKNAKGAKTVADLVERVEEFGEKSESISYSRVKFL